MEIRDLPVYELFISDKDEELIGIALVDKPAIQENFIYFSSDEFKMIFYDDRMIVKGPVMIPNQYIYKNDELGKRYVFMSQDTIYKFVELLMNKKDNKFNELHTRNYIDSNVIESYFATANNEFNVPEGSYIASVKIKNADTWRKVKNGEFKGFSIQGLFVNQLLHFAETEKKNANMKELKEKLINAINNILFDEAKTETEPKVEEPKVEEFAVVDSQEVVDKVEEVIDAAETAVETTTEPLTIETIKSLLEEMKNLIVADFTSKMEDMTGKVVGVQNQMNSVVTKVEEFSTQPISESVVEEVANPSAIKTKSNAVKYFVK